jgi:predicted  nucleic acid-binding Zn-ribbon protein
MASPAYEQILDIQALDLRLTQLRHQVQTHPARATLAQAVEDVTRLEEAAAAIGVRHHELERDQKRLDDEVAIIEAKRKEIEAKLYDGSVTASKDLIALQDEGRSLLERQTRIEDDELEVMEALEELGSELEAGRAEAARAVEAREAAEQVLAQATAELEVEIGQVTEERRVACEPANPTLLARYEELSAQFDGVAVARFVDGRCDGCHMQLSAMAVDQLMKAADDAVVICEECGRLLVR